GGVRLLGQFLNLRYLHLECGTRPGTSVPSKRPGGVRPDLLLLHAAAGPAGRTSHRDGEYALQATPSRGTSPLLPPIVRNRGGPSPVCAETGRRKCSRGRTTGNSRTNRQTSARPVKPLPRRGTARRLSTPASCRSISQASRIRESPR